MQEELEKCERIEVYDVLLKNIEKREEVHKNIEKILFKTRLGNFGKVVEKVSIYQENRKYIVNNFNLLEGLIIPCNIEKVLDVFISYEEYKNIIKKYYLLFLEAAINVDDKDLTKRVSDKLKLFDKNIENEINEFEKKSEKYLNLECYEKINRGTLYKLLKYNKVDYVEKIFLRFSNNIEDIKFISYGYFSSVFKIDKYIIKIGRRRAKFSMPFSKHILQPYVREELYSNNEFICTIEVQDEVDMDSVTEEDLKNVVELIEKERIYWQDARVWNIGRLISNNYNEIKNKNVGFTFNKYSDENLQKKPGDLVIIDTDLIFDENEIIERRKKCYEK